MACLIARRLLRHGGDAAALSRRLTPQPQQQPPQHHSTATTTTTTYGTFPSHGSPAAAAVAAAAERIVLPTVCDHLMRYGYAVVDGALDAARVGDGGSGGEGATTALSETLRAELDALAATPGVMAPNATHLVQKEGTVVKLEKAHILVGLLHHSRVLDWYTWNILGVIN